MQATRDGGDPSDDDLELIRPEDFLPHHPIPDDARRLGFDRWSGAEIAFVSSLDGRKPAHRLFALVLLVAFLLPAVMTVLFLLH